MEDRRHTEPWTAARPSGVPAPGDVETTIKHPKPAPRSDTDERVRGLSIDGRYEIGDCIGAGGMSRVYSGVHTQTGVRVATKLIDPAPSQEPSTKQRLLGEAPRSFASRGSPANGPLSSPPMPTCSVPARTNKE